ncbi:MAG: rRNA pseudouridine synthase [Oscillospiraceae bacterium]|nr:rRNA pseudouridine synthase [Oscillospiraceae bacterium]
MEKIRIQKLLSESGYCSRRKAEALISAGRVKCNGRPVSLGDKATARDLLSVDGENIYMPKRKAHRYIMLNKPRGYVTTMSDEQGRRCVTDLLQDVGERVYPVGRLDRNSEGLLLFTNDGRFANDIMHPSREVSKTYRVTVRPPVSEEQLAQMSAGVTLDDGFQTAPANVLTQTVEAQRVVLLVTIHEGKKREVRRMCDAVGLEVARLRRVSIGPVKLGMLKPGAWRDLTSEELRALRQAIGRD